MLRRPALYYALKIVASFILLIVLAGCPESEGGKVIVKGSTTMLPIMQQAAEVFLKNSKIDLVISGGGSGTGITALLEGECDIAASSRELKPEEEQKAKDKGMELKSLAIAYDMVVPIVNTQNPIQNISLTQLEAIYSGKIVKWQELESGEGEIVVVTRDTNSGTYEVWFEKVMHKKPIRRDALLHASTATILDTVKNNPKAIGYVGFGYVDNSVKALSIDNIPPTKLNGRKGLYPVSRKLFVIFNEHNLTKAAKRFIDFLLSAEGQKIVASCSFITLFEN